MFIKKKKTNIQLDNISQYKEAIKVIKYFLAIGEWQKAKKGINEIKEKEKDAYTENIESIEKAKFVDNKLKEKELKNYNKKIKQINLLESKINKKERLEKDKEQKERFKVRFAKIKSTMDDFVKEGKIQQGMNLLHDFLEENKHNPYVLKYFNKEKKVLLKNMDRQKHIEDKKAKDNIRMQALRLIGADGKVGDGDNDEEEYKKRTFIDEIKTNINVYKSIRESIRKKKLLNEVTILIDEEDKASEDMAQKKLENMHRGLIKEIRNNTIFGYDIYGKILGEQKISGDVVGFHERKEDYIFYIGDATGHGVRAGLIVTLLTRTFNQFVNKSSIVKLAFEINNSLKQNLSSRNFITGIVFGINKENINKINFVGMGHEPMFLYRSKSKDVEKIIPGGLAAGIRTITEIENVKEKSMVLEHNDIVLAYSDGVVETKNHEGENYGFNRLQEVFKKTSKVEAKIEYIYDELLNDLKNFKGSSHFEDDTTILLIRRNSDKDLIRDEHNEFVEDIKSKEHLEKKDIKRFKGKNKTQIEKELSKIKKEKETKNIVKILESLYYTGEVLKLKQECIRYIKEGYIDKKINYYLKKAQENETKYKVGQKEIKLQNKYNVLKELLSKGDYDTVINESEDIISKDGTV